MFNEINANWAKSRLVKNVERENGYYIEIGKYRMVYVEGVYMGCYKFTE